MLEGLIGAIGTVGDTLRNSLCENTFGLCKTECVRSAARFAPVRSVPSPT